MRVASPATAASQPPLQPPGAVATPHRKNPARHDARGEAFYTKWAPIMKGLALK